MATGIGSVNTFAAPPDWQAQQADIQRRMAMAQAMQEQGMQPDGGTQMAGQVAIPNSWTQGLAKALKTGLGAYQQRQLMGEQRKLYQDQQDTYSQAGRELSTALTPRPAQSAQPGMTDEVGGISDPGQAAKPAYTPDEGTLNSALMNYLTKTGRNDMVAPLAVSNAQRQIMMSRMLAPDSSASTALAGGGGPTNENAAAMTAGTGPTIGGIPQALAARLMAADPTGKLLAESQAGLFKQGQAPVINRGFGVGRMVGGQYVPDAASGAQAASTAGAVAGAQAAAKLPYETPQVYNTEGAPTLMTPTQAIQATGAQMPGQAAVSGAPPQIVSQSQMPPMPASDIPLQNAAFRAGQTGAPVTIKSNVAAPSGGGLRLQDQGASAAQKELGQGIGKEASNVFTNGAAAVQANRQLENMGALVQNFTPDRFQGVKSAFGAYLNGLGIPEDEINSRLGTNVGDIRALTSQAVQMAGKLTRQTDAQPSQIQFMKNLQSMPNADMTAQGFQKVLAYMKDMNNYNIEKMIAQQQWLASPTNKGDPSGFEAAWATKAKDLPFIWNQKVDKAANGTPSLQELMDEAKRRGLGK